MVRATLRTGSRGDDVIAWQTYLRTRGAVVTVDGIYGPATAAATRIVQAAAGLVADGIVGPATWRLAAPAEPPAPVALSAFRERVIAHLRPLVGLSDPAPAYRDAICSSDADRTDQLRRSQLGAMSSCALLVRATWAACGVEHPILTAPYRIGRAVSDVVQIARERGAWRGPLTRPAPGDVVVVEGPEHVATVTGWDGDVCLSIDGGQGPGGRAIGACRRMWQAGRLGGRRIIGVVDAAALPATPAPHAPTR